MADNETNREMETSSKRQQNGDSRTQTAASIFDSSKSSPYKASHDSIEPAAKRVKVETFEKESVTDRRMPIAQTREIEFEVVPKIESSPHVPSSTRVKGMASIKPE